MIKNDCVQGAVTMESPFEIRSNGIFFKNSNWGLELYGGNPHLPTITSIQQTLNDAYGMGFSEGVQVGLKFKKD